MFTTLTTVAQMQRSWHEGGLFMGMHWLWWAFWIVLALVIILAFWRVGADRRDTRRAIREEERAEEALRRRFADGEIDEDEFARRLKVLRENMLGR